MKMNQKGNARLSIDEAVKIIDKSPIKFLTSRTTDEGHNISLKFDVIYITGGGVLYFGQKNGNAGIFIPISDIEHSSFSYYSERVKYMMFNQTSGEEWQILLYG